MIIELVLVGIAAWRLALLLTEEDGPFAIFDRIREPFMPPLGEEIERGSLGKLFSCVYCMSFWTALLCYGLYQVEPQLVLFLAMWGVATGFHHATRR